MSRCVQHRGPDGTGVYSDKVMGVSLAHQRLSIIDLSQDSAQPFHSRDGKFVMVYNGEIYNFKELANKYSLERKTNGDTEVLLELFSLKGPEIFSQLSGMFALAILNRYTGEICLARDGRGIKPLYYYSDDKNLVFGSELKSVQKSGLRLSISQHALQNYFNLGFFPKNSTVYEKVRKLSPGHFIQWNSGIEHISSFYEVTQFDKIYDEKSIEEAKIEFKKIFQKAVESRLIGDRTVGTFLSGGIDSSLVSCFANLNRDVPINSYNVKIENAEFDESNFAKRISDIIKTNHHIIEINENNIKDGLVEIIDNIDEPFGDSSYIPTYVLSRYVKKHITVALSGDGGDELFMGYGYYQWPKRLTSFPFKYRWFWQRFFNIYKPSRTKDYSKYFGYKADFEMPQHLFSQEQSFFSKDEVNRLFGTDHYEYRSYIAADYSKIFSDVSEIQSFLDFQNYLPDDLLVKVDRASMSHSLEVRVPFLDKEVVEFAWHLSPELKVKGREGKYLLKEVLSEFLPKDLVYRKKWGFSIPLQNWLLNEFDYLIDESLDDFSLSLFPDLNTDYIKQLIVDFRNGQHFLYNRIWLLLIFFRWVRRNQISI